MPTPKSRSKTPKPDELRPEYDLKTLGAGERGKYLAGARKAFHLVALDPDIAKAFPNEQSVNDTLRAALRFADALRHPAL